VGRFLFSSRSERVHQPRPADHAIKGSKTTAELTSTYGIHATQINNWKKAALDIIPEAFSSKRKRVENDQQALVDELSHSERKTKTYPH
jgi:hypothetical protein